jgi:adenylate kinase
MAPLRCFIAGASGSGKGTQCELITEKYGVVHLSTENMLAAAIASETSEVGMKAKEALTAAATAVISDDLMIEIITERLAQEDCMTKGYILDDFPRTRAQADALEIAEITPDCFIFLDVPDDDAALTERISGRRTDPYTGKIYHTKFLPPPAESEEIIARLTQNENDTEEKTKGLLETFHTEIDAVRECYAATEVIMLATGHPADIFEVLTEFLEAYKLANSELHEEAIAAFDKAEEVSAKANMTAALASAMIGQGNSYLKSRKYHKAT